MGLFSFLKKATGNTADVGLSVAGARRGGKAPITVNVSVGSETIAAKRIYVQLRCNEQIDIPKYSAPEEGASKPAASSEKPKPVHVKADEKLFEQEVTLAPGQELGANSQTKFTGEIDIPAHLPPSFVGKNTTVKWFALAGISTSMIDPSSDWQEISVA